MYESAYPSQERPSVSSAFTEGAGIHPDAPNRGVQGIETPQQSSVNPALEAGHSCDSGAAADTPDMQAASQGASRDQNFGNTVNPSREASSPYTAQQPIQDIPVYRQTAPLYQQAPQGQQVYYQPPPGMAAPQVPQLPEQGIPTNSLYRQAPQGQQVYYQTPPGMAASQVPQFHEQVISTNPLYRQAPQGQQLYYQAPSGMAVPQVPQYYGQPMQVAPSLYQQVPQGQQAYYHQTSPDVPVAQAPQYHEHPEDVSSAVSSGNEAPGEQKKEPKFDKHMYGKVMEMASDMVNGKPPEMGDVMALMEGVDTQFWKGSIIGAAAVFALTNETVKNAAVGTVAKAMNLFGKTA